MKHTLSDKKKLAAKANEQNCEVMLNPKDYEHILFIDRESKVVARWYETYDIVKQANTIQIN